MSAALPEDWRDWPQERKRALVARLRAYGLSVSTGTINDPQLADRAASLGVDAITSDRPAALRRGMAARAIAA